MSVRSFSLLIIALYAAGCTDRGSEIPENSDLISIASLFAINDNQSVTLGWTYPTGLPPVEIRIYRGSSEDFVPSGATIYATQPGSADRFVDHAVTNGVAYYYKVIPVGQVGNGARVTGRPTHAAIGKPVDYSGITTISYSQHIQSLFNSSCAVSGCHGGEANAEKRPGLSKTAGLASDLSLESWDDLFKGSEDGAIVVPYKSQKCDMVAHINADTLVAPTAEPHMPAYGFNIPAAAVQTVIRWIDQGAPNDQGQIAYTNSPRGKIIAVNASEDLLAVTDVQTNLLIRYINVGKARDSTFQFGSPHHVKSDLQGTYFYATLITSQQLWKFSATTYEFLGRVSIPFEPADVVPSITGDTAYVTSFSSNPGRVTLVDTRNMQVLSSVTMTFSRFPHGAVLSHDGSKLFVTNLGSGNVTQINTVNNSQSIIALDTTGNPNGSSANPYLLDISPDDRYLVVTDYAATARNVYVIDLLTDPTRPSRIIPIGGRSIHVAITPDGREAWVCNFTTGGVDVINMTNYSVFEIPDVGKQPHGVVFTPDGATAYVTSENYLLADPPHHPASGSTGVSYMAVIDVATRQIIRRVEMGAFGQGLTYLP